MEQLLKLLSNLKSDIFKLLPMKECEMEGDENYLDDYIENLLINLHGALAAYPILQEQKQFLYIINKISYMASNKDVAFKQWRKIVLDSIHTIDDLKIVVGGNEDAKQQL